MISNTLSPLLFALLATPILAKTSAAAKTSTVAKTSTTTEVSGTAYGFATGVTGGGSATAAAPSDIAELTTWLSDSTARVILIDQTFDFSDSEGTASEAGCYQSTCTPANGGQTYLGTLSCSNSDDISTTISYNVSGITGLTVASDKTILGVGSAGVIKGKGLTLPKTTNNVIIQNVHITDINPASVWGGDAVQLQGNSAPGVWIDHCKFSLVGRMFIVSDYDATEVTISNTEFDGVTPTSATCNDDHYWGAMFIADGDKVTLDKNYWHDMSGRSPKLGEDGVTTTVQVLNNYFLDNSGHDFDIYDGTTALIEGNVFDTVTTPMTTNSDTVTTIYNVPDATSATACSSKLGRACVINSFTDSGTWPSITGAAVLTTWATESKYLVTPIAVTGVVANVTKGAGIGNI